MNLEEFEEKVKAEFPHLYLKKYFKLQRIGKRYGGKYLENYYKTFFKETVKRVKFPYDVTESDCSRVYAYIKEKESKKAFRAQKRAENKRKKLEKQKADALRSLADFYKEGSTW